MSDLIVIVLLLVITYLAWSARRALMHTCAQLSLLCKFSEGNEMSSHRNRTKSRRQHKQTPRAGKFKVAHRPEERRQGFVVDWGRSLGGILLEAAGGKSIETTT